MKVRAKLSVYVYVAFQTRIFDSSEGVIISPRVKKNAYFGGLAGEEFVLADG